MRTPTLVVAIILAMAMAGDSANIERLLHQLRLLAGEETMDDASMTHTKGKSVDTEETQLLDLVKKLSLESKEPEPIDVSGEKSPDVEQNYDMAGLGDQNPTSEEGEAEGDEVTEQNYDQSETGEEYSTSTEDGSEQAPDFGQNYDMTGFQNQDPTSEGVEEEGSTDVEQNYDVAKIGEKDSTLKEDEQAPDVGQNYGMTGREDQDPTSKEVGGEKGPDVEQKYDMTGREDPDQSLRADSNNAFTCRRCQPGHACTLREDICPAGTASNDNRTMCVPCAAGEFSSAAGAESCQKCPAGKYSTGSGSNSCLDCPAGKYSETEGSTSCKMCPAGQYSRTAGSAVCTDCPEGYTTRHPGSSVCADCFSSFQHFPRTDCGKHGEYDIAGYQGVTARYCATQCCKMKACLSFQHNSDSIFLPMAHNVPALSLITRHLACFHQTTINVAQANCDRTRFHQM